MFKDICNELGIKCTLLSKDWIFMLEIDDKRKFFAGYKSSLNDHALGQVIDDKYALFEVLKTLDIPVADYNIVYGPRISEDYAQGCNNFDYVKDYFLKNQGYVVLKPNDGTCGRDVYRVNTLEDLEILYNKLTNKYFSINMGPYYNIKNEYRFIVFNDEVRIAYKKNKPVVYGDGVSTIRDLLINFNSKYFSDRLEDSSYDRVLNVGEEFEYNWKFNLSQGAVATEIDNDELYGKLKDLALRSAQSLGLKFGSVDIIVTEDDEIMILEMNSGVMVENYIEQFKDGYDNAKKLYKDVIIEMFRN
jgi:hypothetical protein